MPFRNGHDPSKTNSVKTPAYIIEFLKKEFDVDEFYDPCPLVENFDASKHKDGLTTDWGDDNQVVYCNPPYSKVCQFFQKGVEEWKSRNKTIIFLVKTDNLATEYFRQFGNGAEIWIISHRLRFDGYTKNNSRFNSCFIILRSKEISNTFKIISLKGLDKTNGRMR